MREKIGNLIRGEKIIAGLVSIFFLLFYVYFQTSSVYGGDGGELISAAFFRGVAHPPGYPLYIFLGWLLTKLPLSTVAWRVTLLSSVPSGISIGIFFLVLKRLIKNTLASLIAVFALGFNYLFWIYSVVPEVFGLHLLFISILLYLLLSFREKQLVTTLYWFSFILGLALSHQQLTLTLVPCFGLYLFPYIKKLKTRNYIISFFCIIAGLFIPYIYVVWAASSLPQINWENPVTINGFFRLITRAIYGGVFHGTHSSGAVPFSRYYDFKIMVELFSIDFTKVGIFLGILGIWKHFKTDKKSFYPFLVGFIFSGPLFIAYLALPSLSNYNLGSLERFFLTPYVIFIIWIGYGMVSVSGGIESLYRRFLHRKMPIPAMVILPLYPLVLLLTNVPKIMPLKNDRTAEKLGQDLLASTPDNGLLLLIDDTMTFNTQYVYYVSGGAAHNRGTVVLSLGSVGLPAFNKTMKKYYPFLAWDTLKSQDLGISAVLKLTNNDLHAHPIVSAIPLEIIGYGWVQEGLVYRLVSASDIKDMTPEKFKIRNEELFAKYQDPYSGALGHYLHVLLADVLRVYAEARRSAGKRFIAVKIYNLAETYLREAIRLQPEYPENHLQFAYTLLIEQKCVDAASELDNVEKRFSEEADLYKLKSILYSDCLHDPTQSQKYQKLYEEKSKVSQTLLRDL